MLIQSIQHWACPSPLSLTNLLTCPPTFQLPLDCLLLTLIDIHYTHSATVWRFINYDHLALLLAQESRQISWSGGGGGGGGWANISKQLFSDMKRVCSVNWDKKKPSRQEEPVKKRQQTSQKEHCEVHQEDTALAFRKKLLLLLMFFLFFFFSVWPLSLCPHPAQEGGKRWWLSWSYHTARLSWRAVTPLTCQSKRQTTTTGQSKRKEWYKVFARLYSGD